MLDLWVAAYLHWVLLFPSCPLLVLATLAPVELVARLANIPRAVVRLLGLVKSWLSTAWICCAIDLFGIRVVIV